MSALDAVLERAVETQRLVGATVLVAHRGQMVYRGAVGYADREKGLPMREDSIFLLASLTKPIVTAAAMYLAEKNNWHLQDSITNWLPFFTPCLPDGSAPLITLEQLLTHTSGLSYCCLELPDSAYHRANVSDGLDQPGLAIEENLRRLVSVPLLFTPGMSWRYSLGLDVVGAAMSELTGSSLGAVVKGIITEPMGLTSLDFSIVDKYRLVTHYASASPYPSPITEGMKVAMGETAISLAPSRLLDTSSYHSGGAGMAGTADDMMQFLLDILGSKPKVLRPSSLEEMTRLRVASSKQTLGPGWGFGLGWAILDDPAQAGTPQSRGTIAWGGIYGHSWFVDRLHAISVVALTNTTPEGMSGAFPIQLRDAVYRTLID